MRNALTRRNLLIGAVAIGASATGGAIWIATADAKAALLDFFKRSLPGVKIDETSANKCIDDVLSQWSMAKTQLLGAAWRTAGIENVAAIDRLDRAPREALTLFLTGSNFFQTADPRSELIVYVGKPHGTACANPFANLDPPQ
jgi:hypothetical protein